MVTDVAGPSAPIITNLTCKDESSIYLQWDRPQVVYKTIDYYYIYYQFDGKTQFREVAVGMNGTLSRGSKVSERTRDHLAFSVGGRTPADTESSLHQRPTCSLLFCVKESDALVNHVLHAVCHLCGEETFPSLFHPPRSFDMIMRGGRSLISASVKQILLEGLRTNEEHVVRVRGATRSIYDSSKVYKGTFSEPQRIRLRLNCDQVQAFTIVRGNGGDFALDLSAGMIAGVACVAFALVLALLALAMWR